MQYKKEFENLKKIWNLKENGKIIVTKTSYIAFVLYKNTPAVLKIFHPNSDEHFSGQALEFFNADKSALILNKNKNAILVEHCIPGYPLSKLTISESDIKSTKIFCYIIKNLYKNNSKILDSNYNFQKIIDLGKGFDKYLNSNNDKINKSLVIDAKNIFFKMARSQNNITLLHGDLHHENILWDKKRGWLAIDPKGIIGEKEVEISAFLKNPIGYPKIYSNEQNILNRINIITDDLKLDKERILKWCYALTILSCIWLLEVNENPTNWLNFAIKIESMLINK